MSIVLADSGAKVDLKQIFPKTAPSGGNDLTLKLFTNNLSPADTNVAGDFTEASGGGYSSKTLTASAWIIDPTSGSLSLTFAASGKTITRGSGSFITDGFLVGDSITTDSSNNPGPFTITAISATVITVSQTVVDETATKTVSIANAIKDARYLIQTFTFTGALTGNATVYGYYVVDADGVLKFSERDASPFTPVSNGDYYTVTLKYQMSKGTPT